MRWQRARVWLLHNWHWHWLPFLAQWAFLLAAGAMFVFLVILLWTAP